MATELGKAYVQIMPSAKGISGSIRGVLAPEVEAAGKDADGRLSGAFKSIGGKIGSALKTAAKVGGIALAGAGTAAVGLAKQAVAGFADYEQLAGGVEKLFGESASIIAKNAAEAYKTSGLSANQYMEQATSFSASLINSLGGDQKKAAEITDVAMRAMSDNVNVFGSNMEDVQNAFQGFSKQNYTMLDNLKLGYGGTKAEMERLIADANEWGAANGKAADLSIDSFADVITAIDYIQQKQNIAGTTAKEAATTISGSLGMLSAAWSNLVTGFARDDADIGELIGNVVSSATSVFENVLPVAEKALAGIAEFVKQIAPVISEKLPGVVQTVLPALMQSAMALIDALVSALPSLVKVIVDEMPVIIQQVGAGIVQALPKLLESVSILINGLWEMAPVLLEALQGLFSGGFAGLSLNGLPDVIQSIGRFITDMVGAFLQELPQFIQFGTDALVSVVNGLLDALPGATTALLNVVTGLVDILLNNLPQFLDSGAKMLGSLTSGLSEKAPDVIRTVGVVLSNILGKLMDALPSMLSKGVELLGAVANGILKNLPAILSALKDVLFQLLRTIIDHLPQFLQQGIELIYKIGIGIIRATPQLLRALGDLVFSIRKEFLSYDWLGIGWSLIKGIAQGIYNAVPGLVSAAIDAVRETWNAMTGWLGISSPSKKARDELGKYWAQGIGVGFSANMPVSSMVDAVSDAFAAVGDATTPALGASVERQAATGGAGAVYVTNHITINQQPGESSDDLIDRLIDKLTSHYEREGAVFANGVPT